MSFILQPQTFLAIGPSRSFGGGDSNQPVFSGYVVLSENTIDALEITQQPVQQGANVADHAFKKPVTFSIQIQMGHGVAGGLLGGLPIIGSLLGKSLSAIYQDLLSLQNSFQPFTCATPKRTYNNMLFAALGVTTDKKTENVLAINATFQEVILVPVTTTIVPRSQLRNAGSNGGNQPAGKKSALVSLVEGIGLKP